MVFAAQLPNDFIYIMHLQYRCIIPYALHVGGPGPKIFIDIEMFEPGTSHNLVISIFTEGGQSGIDDVQFVVAAFTDLPSNIIPIPYYTRFKTLFFGCEQ